jgi:exosome complex component CSL4
LEDRVAGKFAYPGMRIGVIEEFLPGQGTYVEDGGIYSSATGILTLNSIRREVSVVLRTRKPEVPSVGDVVTGLVISTSEKSATIKIMKIDGVNLKNAFTGIMHISDAGRGHVKSLQDQLRPGDIVRAKVISTKNREYHLSMKEDTLGVVKAFCVHCGQVLTAVKGRLRCISCGAVSHRKISSDYYRDNRGL